MRVYVRYKNGVVLDGYVVEKVVETKDFLYGYRNGNDWEFSVPLLETTEWWVRL